MSSVSELGKILSTPLSIQEVVVSYFPCGRVELIDGDPPRLAVSLGPKILNCEISSAVEEAAFRDSLQKISEAHRLIMHGIGAGELSLNPINFSIEAPLTDWHPFKRLMFEAHGGNCAGLLLEYLTQASEELSSKLGNLGLLPEQVTEREKNYFVQLAKKICAMPLEKSEPIIAAMGHYFPEMVQQVSFDMIKEEETSPKSDSENQQEFDSKRALVLLGAVLGLGLGIVTSAPVSLIPFFGLFGSSSAYWIPNLYQYLTSKMGISERALTTARGSLVHFELPKFSPLEPTNREYALKLLNLTDEQASDSVLIKQHYELAIEGVSARLNTPSIFSARSQEILDAIHVAYKTLTTIDPV